jgi:hypothetical protein
MESNEEPESSEMKTPKRLPAENQDSISDEPEPLSAHLFRCGGEEI